MKTFNQFIDKDGKSLLNNFPLEIQHLLNKEISKSEKIEIKLFNKNTKARIGKLQNESGSVIVFSIEERYVNSSNFFYELLNISLISLENIIQFRNNFSLNQNEYVQDLVHNLTSLNTYNVQELESLIPSKILTQNINTQKDVIKNIITEKPIVTASTLLKLIKYNYAMKVEFSVFEKTIMQNPKVQKLELSIKEIILSILQVFIQEFEQRNIIVSIDNNEKRFHVDFEILFVSLFYILENAIKYCCSNSNFKILLKEEHNRFNVIFDMLSLRIEDEEVSKICQKKFRAKSAIELTEDGKGIGMSRVLKTLKLNNAEIEIVPRVTNYTKVKNNLVYEHNQFILKFDTNRLI
jgi:hypothetical protein